MPPYQHKDFNVLNTRSILYLILNQFQRALTSFKNWFVFQLANNPYCMEHEAPAIAFMTLSYINRILSTLSKTVGFKTSILLSLLIRHLPGTFGTSDNRASNGWMSNESEAMWKKWRRVFE